MIDQKTNSGKFIIQPKRRLNHCRKARLSMSELSRIQLSDWPVVATQWSLIDCASNEMVGQH